MGKVSKRPEWWEQSQCRSRASEQVSGQRPATEAGEDVGTLDSGSQQTHETLPLKRPEGRKLTGKADQVFRGFEKANSRNPTHDKVTRRKPDRQGRSGFQGFRKAAPDSHLKDDICLSDAFLNGDYSLISLTQAERPSPISFQIRINLEL